MGDKSEDKRFHLQSRQGTRVRSQVKRLEIQDTEVKVLRVRGQPSSTKGMFDDRFEIESRGKVNPTGLSGTSDPDAYSRAALESGRITTTQNYYDPDEGSNRIRFD
jgi:hypothetical protein